MKRPWPWDALEPEKWTNFEQYVDRCNVGWPNKEKWLFRGQSNADWRLEPAIQRVLRPGVKAGRVRSNGDAWKIEEELRRQFYQDAHNWIPATSLPQKPELYPWNAWAVMQHFGAPTRLLDWSLSAYVALFFACQDGWGESDGAVYCVRSSSIAAKEARRYPQYDAFAGPDWSAPEKQFVQQETPTRLIAFFPVRYPADRMYMQQGWFSICSDALVDHETALSECLGSDPDGALVQLIIPRDEKADMMRRLQAMNITGRTLFPGADGLGRSVMTLARLSATYGL